MTKYSKDKEVQRIVEAVLAQGWRVSANKRGGHYVLYPADTAQSQITIPGTPSDHRASKNFRAQVRRAGGIV